MKLNLSSLSFNIDLDGGKGTPAWGTELGQDVDHKFSDGLQDFLTAMLYKSIPDTENITCPLGKGGQRRDAYDFVVGSVFDKVYVNGTRVPDAKMLLLIVRLIKGEYHVGRMTLKYNPNMTYKGEPLNQICYTKIASILGTDENGAWFADRIFTRNQDELHLSAYYASNAPISFHTTHERKRFYLEKIQDTDGTAVEIHDSESQPPLQVIYYGAPGTGKSHKIKSINKELGIVPIRTTFHPDSDYSTFVGSYKPTMEVVPRFESSGTQVEEKRIVYNYIPQAFLRAYVSAWKHYPTPQYLVIEEINRGNCAQIFGDLFQLLDRSAEGFSDYPIIPDSDITKYLNDTFKKEDVFTLSEEQKNEINSLYKEYDDLLSYVKSGEMLLLPKNLHILATMNTSDQSLFPIDSAFKRRWAWEYIPIADGKKGWVISANGSEWDWWTFVQSINTKIGVATDSEDKKLGYYFIKPSDGHTISAALLVSKVLFYLWNDIFRDYGFDDDVFQTEDGKLITFPMFYEDVAGDEVVNERLVQTFLHSLMGDPLSEAEETISENNEEEVPADELRQE